MSLSQQIHRLRKERGWTQEMLAEKVSVTHRHVSRWETARTRPSGRMLKRLAEVFGVLVDDLLGAEAEHGVSFADPEIAQRFRQLEELEPQDRAMVLRMIDVLATQKNVQRLLSGAKQAS